MTISITRSLATDFGGADFFSPDYLCYQINTHESLAEVACQGSVSRDGDVVTIQFDNTLSPGQEAVVDSQIIAQHRLNFAKTLKQTEIDEKTQELIQSGFLWKGHRVSLSPNAQSQWLTLGIMYCLETITGTSFVTYPVQGSDKDNYGFWTIANPSELLQFYLAAISTAWGHLTSGNALKQAIRDAQSFAEVEAVQDNRVDPFA